jgi:hypothetical protein
MRAILLSPGTPSTVVDTRNAYSPVTGGTAGLLLQCKTFMGAQVVHHRE